MLGRKTGDEVMSLDRTMSAALLSLLAGGTVAATEVAVCTDRGRAVLELADEQAPLHVANFLRYVDMGLYSGTVFHRVMPGVIVQGGGLDRQLRPRPTLSPVANESRNGLRNERGTVAAARTADPDSASAQFFVNLAENRSLDGGRDLGYTVFARVKEGMALFDEVGRLPTGAAGPFSSDVPTPLIAITSIARLDEAALAVFRGDGRELAIKSEIMAAATADDAAATLRLVDHYRAICGDADPEVALTEARAAFAVGDEPRGLFALEELLATTDATHATYAAARALRDETLAEDAVGPQVVNDCDAPATPTLPDAATATEAEMISAQRQVRAFVAAGETYLACLATIIDDEDRAAEERNTAVSEHNRMVAELEQIAAAFNERIRAFRARG
jgi:peptidyl-prolyl cis-trans isomerase A (cyclophilin A)/peptidyl-prolyl cis-trans isomerase B (cyclophilin B)